MTSSNYKAARSSYEEALDAYICVINAYEIQSKPIDAEYETVRLRYVEASETLDKAESDSEDAGNFEEEFPWSLTELAKSTRPY